MSWMRPARARTVVRSARGRVGLALACAAAAAGVLGVAAPARADEPKVEWKVRVEPEVVPPGGKGTLILDAVVPKGVHVAAEGEFKVEPKASAGVSYEKENRSDHVIWEDPQLPGEKEPVWFDSIRISIPFTLASDAPHPAVVGASVRFHYCDESECYPTRKVPLEVSVPTVVTAASTPPAPAPGGNGSAVNGAPPPPSTPPGVAIDPKDPAPARPPAKEVKTTIEGETADVEAAWKPGVVKVFFMPKPPFHLYLPGAKDVARVEVSPETPRVVWDAPRFPEGEQSEQPFEATITYTAPEGQEPDEVRVKVTWAGCSQEHGCKPPERWIVAFTKDGAKAEPYKPAPLQAPPAMDTPTPAAGPDSASTSASPAAQSAGSFPATGRIYPDDPDDGGSMAEASWIERRWQQLGFLVLGVVFLAGIGLAFTPCVLPLIPITVSIIGGGRADMPRGRLVGLLSAYVAGLSLTFGLGGLAAGLLGASVSAAFQSPIFLWGLGALFVVLGMGMFGIFELRVPQALTRLQGGAKGGSVLGAFVMGVLAAFIASPCTGPVIIGMLVFTAKSGNALIGFLMFLALGLGMGAVLFAAGALNMLARPGPWMVWVRYVFGVLMVGMALFYLALADKLVPPWLFVVGFTLALGAGVLIARHLVRGEGEELGRAAGRGAKVAVLLAAATGVVALLTRPVSSDLEWVTVRDRAHLVAEVEAAANEGRPVVVDVWATWCTYCKKYDVVIEQDAALKRGFAKLKMLRINVTDEESKAATDSLRDAVGIPRDQQPYMVFVTPKKLVRPSLSVDQFYSDPVKELKDRLEKLGVLSAN